VLARISGSVDQLVDDRSRRDDVQLVRTPVGRDNVAKAGAVPTLEMQPPVPLHDASCAGVSLVPLRSKDCAVRAPREHAAQRTLQPERMSHEVSVSRVGLLVLKLAAHACSGQPTCTRARRQGEVCRVQLRLQITQRRA
jgi:hypothetical protein